MLGKTASHCRTRFIELDLLRGFALLMMIGLHLLWDLDYFGILALNNTVYQSNVLVQVLFFSLVGVCQAVRSNRSDMTNEQRAAMSWKMAKRGGLVLAAGMAITAATLVVMPDRPIFFGVLHCIGLCSILSIPFLRLKAWAIVPALAFIVSGIVLGSTPIPQTSYPALIIGIHPSDVMQHTVDYFPVLPWFGVVLAGIAVGSILYKNSSRTFPVPDLSHSISVKVCTWFGRHSLPIYLVHQPLIAGVLFLRVFL